MNSLKKFHFRLVLLIAIYGWALLGCGLLTPEASPEPNEEPTLTSGDASAETTIEVTDTTQAPTETSTTAEENRPLADLEPADRNNYFDDYPEMVIDLEKEYEAIIYTNRGELRLVLFDEEAPLTVNSFVFLANQGYYDNVIFHRVLPDFMAQGGDPTGSGSGGPGYSFVNETDNDLVFDRRGLLAMANAGPNTNGSQFFITFGPAPHLNGGYTIFGELSAGDDVLSALTLIDPTGAVAPADATPDRIERIEIVEQ
jgi:cyclophilin family peptidyl-prolyl cis-trans isomerase